MEHEFLQSFAHWDLAMIEIYKPATDVWEMVTAIGTVSAALVALAISLTQAWRDWRKVRRIQHAIAPALIGDLVTAKAVLKTINETATKFLQVRMTNAREVAVVVNLGRSLVVPSFDKFKDLLPDLGSAVAPKVIETYGKIIRIMTLTSTYPVRVASVEEASSVVNALRDGSTQLIDEIEKTIPVLERLHPNSPGQQ